MFCVCIVLSCLYDSIEMTPKPSCYQSQHKIICEIRLKIVCLITDFQSPCHGVDDVHYKGTLCHTDIIFQIFMKHISSPGIFVIE